MYVADTWNHRIQKFDSQGQFETMWGVFESTGGELGTPLALYGPRTVAVGQDGNVYVMDTGNKRVQAFRPDGTFVAQYGGGGVVDGRFDEPVGLAQDGAGNWYVADTWNHRIQKFDAGFQYVGQWAVNGWGTQSVVNKPYLAVDSARGLVYATDPEGYRVLVFDTGGQFKGDVRVVWERCAVVHLADGDRRGAGWPGVRGRWWLRSHHDLPTPPALKD